MTKFWTLALWLILMWGGSAPIEARAVGCLANIRLSRLTGTAPIRSCAAMLSTLSTSIPPPTQQVPQPITASPAATPVRISQANITPTVALTASAVSKIDLQLITLSTTVRTMNSLPVLHIGPQVFEEGLQRRCHITQSQAPFRETIICSLTAAEFASVNDGDLVTYTSGESWVFGPLNKTKLVMKESLPFTRQRAIENVKQARGQVSEPQLGARLDTTLQQLAASNAPSHWRDEWHLQLADGLDVLQTDVNTVVLLEQIKAAPPTNDALFYTEGAIADLLHVDRELSDLEIEEAGAAGAAQSKIVQAENPSGQAIDEERMGKYADAATHYRDAWQYARDAMQSVTPAPTLMPTATVTPAVTPGQG